MTLRTIENSRSVDGAKIDNLPSNTTAELAGKQETLISGTNIKTVNGSSILGSGNLDAGAGTVTSVSVTTANGVSGTVATETTTPAISISLGDITPTKINGNTLTTGTGTITITGTKTLTVSDTATVSGTNSGDNAANSSALALDQVTPQTITGGQPIQNTLTASEIVATDGSKKLQSLAVATYPSLTELSYVKGVTSAIQTQIGANLSKAGGTMTGKIVSSGSSEVAKTYTPGSGAQSVEIDCSLNNIHEVTVNSGGTDLTFTITGATNSQVFIVSILQGASTLSTITARFATVRWAGGTAPTLTATASKRDTFGFRRTGADTYDGFIIGQNC